MYPTILLRFLTASILIIFISACSEKTAKKANNKDISTTSISTANNKPKPPPHPTKSVDNHNLEIIPLKYRSADKLVSVIRPHLSPGGNISYEDKRLIISSNDENLLLLKVLIAELDIPKKQLRLSIDTDYHATYPTNETEQIHTSIFSTQTNTTNKNSLSQTRKRNTIQHLLVAEEQTAALTIEKDRSLASIGWPPAVFNQQTLQAFKITPHLSKQQVTLHIDIINTDQGKKNSIQTVIIGELNQWIVINGESVKSSLWNTRDNRVSTRRRQYTPQIAIKVEAL